MVGVFVDMMGRYFLRAFEIKRYIKSYLKMPCKRLYFSIGAPLENLKGFACRDFLKEKKVYLGSSLGPRGYYDFKSGSHVKLW
jgi:hypothetical protein